MQKATTHQYRQTLRDVVGELDLPNVTLFEGPELMARWSGLSADLIHPGHISLLRDARGQGDLLLVAINDDASVRRLKGASRPVYPVAERAEILLALRWVDAVTSFAEDTPAEAIAEVRPHVLVKGAEYGSGEIVGEAFVTSYGGEVVRFPMRKGFATTNIVDRIARKNGQQG